MSVDVVGDFLTVIRNALMVHRRSLVIPFSKLKLDIAKVLKNEGFIKDFKEGKNEKGHSTLIVFLKYVNGISVINEIRRISRPGCRCYQRKKNISPVTGGLGISILSTSSGVMTDRQARQLSIGGEVLCSVW